MNTRPNILLFITDDQGWDDLSLHGNPWLETPRLDRLARESVQFQNFIVAPVCSATRAALLTGRHFLRTGVAHVHGGKDFIHPDEALMSEAFREAGYTTALWGKWHSGKTTGYLPWERGFDEAYMARLYIHKDNDGYLNGQHVQHEGWTTETLADYGVNFLEKQKTANQPFFACVPFLTPHSPLNGNEQLIAKYEAMGLSRAHATLYAMIEQTDLAVGRILDALELYGQAENTIVLFMSDNGPACLADFTDDDREKRNINGYKGWKGNMWENGIRSPLFVRWPGRFAPHTVERLCDVCDIFPTLADLCGVDLSDWPFALDGRSIAPYLEGDEQGLPKKESYLWVSPGWPPDPKRPWNVNGMFNEYDPVPPEDKPRLNAQEQLSGFRGEEWKYMQKPGRVPHQPEPVDGDVLIRIADDPREDANVLSENRDTARELQRKTQAWFEEIKRESHSFHVPEFVIRDDDPHTFIAAYAPERTHGGALNAGLALRNLTAPGDGADYRVRVEKGGRYRVEIEFERAHDNAVTLRLSCGENRVTHRAGGGGVEVMGELELPEGAQSIRLEVADADPSDEPIIEKVIMFRFVPIEATRGWAKSKAFDMSDDFDAPLEDFKEYG